MKILFYIFLTSFLTSCFLLQKQKIVDDCIAIYELMQDQEQCWNNGNIDDFMSKYWKSDSLIFIGKSGINYGWKTTILNYKKSYKNKTEMGILKFKNIICNPINDSTHIVTGKWSLLRNDSLGSIGGYYTLIWMKKNDFWKIIYDHTS
jgi:hypothetical protein